MHPRGSNAFHRRLAVVLLGAAALASSPRLSQPRDEALRRNNLGVGLMDAGTKDPKYVVEAVREFEAALALSPDYPTARLNLGIALYYAGETERAARTLERVLRDRPGSLRAHFVLGLLREYAAQFAAAAGHFRRVAEQDRTDADAWYHLGFCLGRTERYGEAVDAFRRAAVIAPYRRRIRYGLFMALNRAGRSGEAQTELEAFRSLATSQIRVVEGPKNTREYLKQGRYAEVVADSREQTPPRRAPVYEDIGASVGIAPARARRSDADVDAVLRGDARPEAFFARAQRRTSVGAATSVAAAFVDVDNDGRLDVYTLAAGVQALYVQQRDARFVRAGSFPASGRALAAVWGDLENDGWTDLVVAEPGRIVIFTNHRGRVRPGPRRMISLPPGYRAAGLALADVEHDGDVDIAVAGGVDLSRPRQRPELRFPADFERRPNLLLRNNSDGTFTEIGRDAGFADAGDRTFRIWFGDVNEDRAVDAVLVGAGGGQTVLLNRKDGSFSPAPAVRTRAVASTRLDEARAFGDFNSDGAVDALVVGLGGVRLLRNDARPSNWLTVRPRGYVVAGKVKSNRLGIGTTLEVRSPGFWERHEVRAGNGVGGTDAAEITFELGSEQRLDFVRAIFPSGVRRTETSVASNRVIVLDEPLLDVNSCPTIFTWNGTRFEFITDTLSAGILGELVAPGQYWQPDPDEWVRIEERQLAPHTDGALLVRFTNPLEEVTYLDAVRLLAVDHPGDTDVYTDERMLGTPDPARVVRLVAVARPRALSRATDHHGHDVSEALASADRRYFDHFAPRPFKGFAGDWALTLDVGPLAEATRPVLGIEGWSYWNSSAAIVAAAQAGERLWGPFLEVQDLSGRWRLATDDLGLIAGLPRTMVVDLQPYLRSGEHVIRIRTNRTLFYDRIWVGDAVAVRPIEGSGRAPLSTAEAPLTVAQLRWLGYPRRRLPDGALPDVFDYQHIEQTADWGTHAGLLTRYGDVRPLLAATDSHLVVMGHGEEVALQFDGAGLPPRRPGWRRTFFLYANGFEKGYEINSARAETVGPLPYQGMIAFPFDPLDRPVDARDVQYEVEWNTRPAFLRVPR